MLYSNDRRRVGGFGIAARALVVVVILVAIILYAKNWTRGLSGAGGSDSAPDNPIRKLSLVSPPQPAPPLESAPATPLPGFASEPTSPEMAKPSATIQMPGLDPEVQLRPRPVAMPRPRPRALIKPHAMPVARESIPAHPTIAPAPAKVTRPQLAVIRRVGPEYPMMARLSGLRGTVTVTVVVSPDGRVTRALPEQANPLLMQAAENAARQWIFNASVAGKEAPVRTATIAFRFGGQ